MAMLCDTRSEICFGIFLQKVTQHTLMSLQSWLQAKCILVLVIQGDKIPVSTNGLKTGQVTGLNLLANPIDIYALFRRQNY